ncbi:MAG: efflux transporter periplasmic adaptor subunit [Gammaproteobacteria bacterium HGW-Gammaproteobacteria-15]|nr:MAG: efflux transporter periplasmic adaptor subunit [Gammaproteobacteria bacterium HGW-Gammaproteobacteria-15]
MKPFTRILFGVVVGVMLGASGVWLLSTPENADNTATDDERKPQYWVAPMDPNYKRDKPGKSPMGMDLIPVYQNESDKDEAGTVTISPAVVNNLGVRTAKVAKGQLDLNVRTVGYLQYDENRLVHVSPRVEGWIEKLYVKAAGDPVKQGEPLFALYSPTLVNAQEELLLALKRDNTILINAAVERLLALQVAQADIDQLRKTKKASQTVTIFAPQSGVVDSLEVREGMFVKPGISLMSIGQLEHLWLIGEVFERQASVVYEGDPVHVRLDYLPAREWEGKVDYIYPSLNTKTRTARVRVKLANPDAFLKPGMFAQLNINTQAGAEELLIPREALIRTGSQNRVVLALGDGKFKSVAVEPGRIGEQQVEIVSGLSNGERIVTSAQFLIDSESSKTSDFKRMTQREPMDEQMDEQTSQEDDAENSSVWVAARIDSLMPEHRMVTLEHDAIPEWQWPAMVMDFSVDERVDMVLLKPGMRLQVQITNDSNENYSVSGLQTPGQEAAEDKLPEDRDHSQNQGMSMPEHDGMKQDSNNEEQSDLKEHNHD